MTDTFPLYDSLLKSIPKKKMLIKQKTELLKFIKQIDDKGAELVYTLIRHHEKQNSALTIYSIPFDGLYLDKESIQFDLEKFPDQLNKIIYNFVILHLKTMEEDVNTPRN